jgi:hypothetical protein
MNKTFNLYCDESTHLQHDGMPYMMIAYISSPYNEIKQHKEYFKFLKIKHKFKGETKWSSVSAGQYLYYADLIDYFFSTDLCFRSIIVDKSQINESHPGFSYDEFYFKMYYQLIHHKVSLAYHYNIYLDIKDTRSHKKLATLKEILKLNTSIKSFQFIRSHESSFMQLTDLIMGAINYKLRGCDKVIAKNRIIEKIEQHSKVPITQSTPKNADKFNLFFIDLK